MVQPADQEFFARLAELNEKFAARLPATLDRLAALSQALDGAYAPAAAGGDDPFSDPAISQADNQADNQATPAAELQAMLHTLAGSAATFGFRGLGHHARLLEQRLRVLRTFDAVAAADWQAWRAELDDYIVAARTDPKALA